MPAVGVFTNWFKHNLYGGAYGGKQNYFVNLRNGLSQSTYDQIITYFLGQSSVYTDSMNLSEWHIYGSSRIGIYQTSINMAYRNIRIVNSVTTQETSTTVTLPSYTLFSVERGSKRYELTNHLGNVLAVVSDKKIQVCTSTAISYYTADLVSATDYSPFGAPLAGRSYTAPNNAYRFAFNGKEKDNETYGEGNAYDFGARIYDSRLGRWMSPDPKEKNYCYISPYSFALNTPVNATDIAGKDVYLCVWFSEENKTGHAGIAVDNYKMVEIRNEKNEITGYNAVPDGTVTYYDLWPESSVGKTGLQSNVTPDYGEGIVLNKEDLMTTDPSASGEAGKVSQFGEGRAPDGVVSIKSGFVNDVLTKVEAINKIAKKEEYNACSNNCSTFSQALLNVATGGKIDASQDVRPGGVLKVMGYKDAKTIAPNNLFNTAAATNGANVLKGPAQVEAKPYLEYFGKENRQ